MSVPAVFNFTKPTLSSLPLPPKGKRQTYRDTKEKGLVINVRPTGSKSFYLYKKIQGRPECILLGGFPDITVENARKAAAVLKGQIAAGLNPQQEKRRIRNEMTFRQLFEEYMERYSKLHKKTWQQDETEIKKYAGKFFGKRISQITKSDVRKLHATIGKEHGIYQANKVLSRIKAVFNKAIEWEWQGTNPANRIRKFKETSRDRFLQPDELPRFLAALEAEHNSDIQDYIWLLLLTGSRKSKVLSMRWEQVNWQRREWHIPDTKNGDPVVVPLMDKVVTLLERRRQQQKEDNTPATGWVFPNPNTATGHMISPKAQWQAFLKRAQISNFRMHDLRRTLGSYQAITGASLQIIGKSLGHRSPSATMIYARLNTDPVREAITKATQAMFAFSTDKEAGMNAHYMNIAS